MALCFLVGLLSLSSLAWVGVPPHSNRTSTKWGTVKGTRGGPLQLQSASDLIVVCTTTFGTGACEDCYDNDTATYVQESSPSSDTVIVDFGAGNARNITYTTLYWSGQRTSCSDPGPECNPPCRSSTLTFYDLLMYYSDDGAAWTQIDAPDTFTFREAADATEDFWTDTEVISSGAHRYWKISITNWGYNFWPYCITSGWARIREWTLYHLWY